MYVPRVACLVSVDDSGVVANAAPASLGEELSRGVCAGGGVACLVSGGQGGGGRGSACISGGGDV